MLEEDDIVAIRIELEQIIEKHAQSNPIVAIDMASALLFPRMQRIEKHLNDIMLLMCARAANADIEVDFVDESEVKVNVIYTPKTNSEDSKDED